MTPTEMETRIKSIEGILNRIVAVLKNVVTKDTLTHFNATVVQQIADIADQTATLTTRVETVEELMADN